MKTQNLGDMLDKFRDSAGTFMRDQAKQFRALAPTDQRELLFYLVANMAVSQSAQAVLAAIEPERPHVQ